MAGGNNATVWQGDSRGLKVKFVRTPQVASLARLNRIKYIQEAEFGI